MEQSGSKRALGAALVMSAVVMLALAALFWTRVIRVAPDARPFLGGALALAGLVDLGVGVKLLQSANAGDDTPSS
jgi:hypothetical protein